MMMVLALDSYAGSCVRVYKEIKREGEEISRKTMLINWTRL